MPSNEKNSEENSEAVLNENTASEIASTKLRNHNDLQDWGGRSRTYNHRINSAALCH